MARKGYIDGQALTAVAVEYYEHRKAALEAGEEEPDIPEMIGIAMYKIANNYARSGKFGRLTAQKKDDMIQSGILNALENFKKTYSPEKSKTKNCFSFLTTLVYFGFLGYFSGEKKALRDKNSQLNAIALGQTAVGGQNPQIEHMKSIATLRTMIDDYNMDEVREQKRAELTRERNAS